MKSLQEVAEKCYIPAGKKLLKLIKKHDGKFKLTVFNPDGVALEQMEMYSPGVYQNFKKLVDTGCVELIVRDLLPFFGTHLF